MLTRAGTFACASRGVTIHFVGKPAHAAYPETGISPAPAVGQLLVDLPALAAPEQYRGITLCTVIGAQMGEKAFGAAAESAELWLTLRGEHDDDLARLRRSVLTRAQERLVLVGSVRDYARAENRWDALMDAPGMAGSYLDLLMSARAAAQRDGQPLFSTAAVHSAS